MAKKIKRRPKDSRRMMSIRESTVRRLAAVMEPWESFADGIDRAVSALVVKERRKFRSLSVKRAVLEKGDKS